ncbi:hypothetical protein [Frigidibacter sp. ROC022]|uniref:hypothetical protein n=1 Tax=Frigidibacter sp. ROC022 TaxID=2971796 RepID=UPI00215ACC18|nr:hypothetical protein [Frigidibacter sp. ROC022]MCR8723705.1 hypothetical protein [Frigidibacter sp. ROC022]
MMGEVLKALGIGLGCFVGLAIYWKLKGTELQHGPVLPAAMVGVTVTLAALLIGWVA